MRFRRYNRIIAMFLLGIMVLVVAAPAAQAGVGMAVSGAITVEKDLQHTAYNFKCVLKMPNGDPYWKGELGDVGDVIHVVEGGSIEIYARTTDMNPSGLKGCLGAPLNEQCLKDPVELTADGWRWVFKPGDVGYALGLPDFWIGYWNKNKRTFRFLGIKLFTKTKQEAMRDYVSFSIIPGGKVDGILWTKDEMKERVQWAYVTWLMGSGGSAWDPVALKDYCNRMDRSQKGPSEELMAQVKVLNTAIAAANEAGAKNHEQVLGLIQALTEVVSGVNSRLTAVETKQAQTDQVLAELLKLLKDGTFKTTQTTTPTGPPPPVQPATPRTIIFQFKLSSTPPGPFDLYWKFADGREGKAEGYSQRQTTIDFSATENQNVAVRFVWHNPQCNVIGEYDITITPVVGLQPVTIPVNIGGGA